MAMMIPASVTSPREKDMTAAIINIKTSGLKNRRRKSGIAERRFGGAGSLGPNCVSRAAASWEVNPPDAAEEPDIGVAASARFEALIASPASSQQAVGLGQRRADRCFSERHGSFPQSLSSRFGLRLPMSHLPHPPK